MAKLFLRALLAGCLLFTLGCDFDDWHEGSSRFTEDFHHSYPLKPGGRLSIENFNGSVEIYGWDKDQVEINGTKHASTKDNLAAIKIDIVPAADSIQIRSIRPSEIRRGNMGVRYRLHVPRKTRLERVQSSNGGVRVESMEGEARFKTSNGGVRLMRFHGDVDVSTSNGPVELSDFTGAAAIATSNGPVSAAGITGHLEATTSNGAITVNVSKIDGSRPVRLRTSNGPVRLTLDSPLATDVVATTSNGPITVRMKEGAGARLKAATSNSSISSDFELNAVMQKSKTRLEATIGSGGALLDLSTSNGPVKITRN